MSSFWFPPEFIYKLKANFLQLGTREPSLLKGPPSLAELPLQQFMKLKGFKNIYNLIAVLAIVVLYFKGEKKETIEGL